MVARVLQCAQNAVCTLHRKQKLEEIEKRRQEEEEQMEARRRELLSEEDGYWRRRMAQEAQTQALQEESIVKANPQVCHTPPWRQLRLCAIWKHWHSISKLRAVLQKLIAYQMWPFGAPIIDGHACELCCLQPLVLRGIEIDAVCSVSMPRQRFEGVVTACRLRRALQKAPPATRARGRTTTRASGTRPRGPGAHAT